MTDTHNESSPDNDSDLESIGYAAALDELDQILDELDDDRIDIDVLSERVERAAQLIAICRSRIGTAQARVAEVVATLETDPVENAGAESDEASPM